MCAQVLGKGVVQLQGRCSDGALAFADNAEIARADALSSIGTTAVIIALLLLFIYVFNLGISGFSKTLLQPLRALVDDMLAMSSLELIDVDADALVRTLSKKPGKKPRPVDVVEEVVNLQSAFRTMRTSIRSWSKYVPPAVVQKLFTAGVEAAIGVVKINATVLFCDLDGFDDMCRDIEPHEIVLLLEKTSTARRTTDLRGEPPGQRRRHGHKPRTTKSTVTRRAEKPSCPLR